MENAGLCLKLCKEWDLISISVGGVTGNITMIVHFSEHFIECLYYEWWYIGIYDGMSLTHYTTREDFAVRHLANLLEGP